MYRVFLISLFNLINLCFNASGYDTDYSSSSNINGDGRHFSEYNDDDVDEEKMNLMGLDYYNGGEGYRNEYSREQMQMASHDGGSRDVKGNIVVLDSQDARNYKAELLAGNKADVVDANPNHYQPDTYPDFGRRRSEPPFIDVTAPPEMVIAIAKESVLLNAAEVKNPTDDLINKDFLRTGNYWNAFWTDEVDPQILRQKTEKPLDTMKMEVRPQSELYNLILKLKQISPTLLYVINN